MSGRPSLSTVLLLGGFVLLVAIAVGMNMGNRVLGQIGAHVPVQPTAVPAATDEPGQHDEVAGWKRVSVMSVATDPGFPDPRITPEPEVPATPRPRPSQTKSPPPNAGERSDKASRGYTSPPLPLPLVTHTPAEPETPGPDIEATAPAQDNRGVSQQARSTQARPTPHAYLTMPPVPIPSYNP